VNSAPKKRILGIPNRYYVLLFLILIVVFWMIFPPIRPHVQLPAEAYSSEPFVTLPIIGPFYWTNTLTAMLITDVLLILLALIVRRVVNSGELVPKGITGVVEALLEIIHNLTETTAGKWTKAIFPFFASITLFVLLVNWMELLPGVDSIGILEKAKEGQHGYMTKEILPGIYTIYEPPDTGMIERENAEDTGHFVLIPYVRVLSTDLNFTVGLALVAVIMTQIMGVRSLGLDYFSKFINVRGLFTRPIFGIIDFGVGLLELISEFSKILSFSFRLFGNIFAGSVLLFVMGTLLPVIQFGFLMLEFFVGLIQAVVFGMLTMVFMSQATAGHGGHEEAH
jgi:F-type H+-transporting ATPase subunit a